MASTSPTEVPYGVLPAAERVRCRIGLLAIWRERAASPAFDPPLANCPDVDDATSSTRSDPDLNLQKNRTSAPATFTATHFDDFAELDVDVFERLVTSAEDDGIREVALGGIDTAARSQVVWAVKTLAPSGSAPACNDALSLPQIGTGRLRARARQDRPQTDLCVIPPSARYRGPENQLYRVEIHQGGAASATGGGATWKWSRENGSVVLPVDDVRTAGPDQMTVTLAAWGRDARRLGRSGGRHLRRAEPRGLAPAGVAHRPRQPRRHA